MNLKNIVSKNLYYNYYNAADQNKKENNIELYFSISWWKDSVYFLEYTSFYVNYSYIIHNHQYGLSNAVSVGFLRWNNLNL